MKAFTVHDVFKIARFTDAPCALISQYLIKHGNSLNQGVDLFVATDKIFMIIEQLLAHFLPAQEKSRVICMSSHFNLK